MRLIKLIAAAFAAIGMLAPGFAAAQQPIKVGIGIAPTGPLGGGGKAALLALSCHARSSRSAVRSDCSSSA